MRDLVSILYLDIVMTLLMCAACMVHHRPLCANAFRSQLLSGWKKIQTCTKDDGTCSGA